MLFLRMESERLVSGVVMFLRAICPIVFAVLLLLGAPAATAQSAAAQSAAGSVWGVLAEMAGRDYEGNDFFVTVRWVEPGKHLQMDRWTGDWSGNFKFRFEFEHDPATGRIRHFAEGRKDKDDGSIKADRDGSIAISYRRGKFEPWLTRGEGGVIIWGKRKLAPLDPAGKQG